MSCVLHPHALLAGASELVTCRLLICGLLSIDLLSHKQAAEAAGRRYVWSVSASDGLLLARVLSVVDGCLNPDPASRWTIPRVLEALTAVQRDGFASSAASVVRPPQLPSPTGAAATVAAAAPSFDVLAIVDCAITDLEVTFGAALGPKDFHRIATKSGQGADINKGACDVAGKHAASGVRVPPGVEFSLPWLPSPRGCDLSIP